MGMNRLVRFITVLTIVIKLDHGKFSCFASQITISALIGLMYRVIPLITPVVNVAVCFE